MDIPCHTDHFTPREAIDLTIRNTLELKDLVTHNFVPVVQGYSLNDFRRCVKEMNELGLLSDYIGVGSVCYRQPRSASQICWMLLDLLKGKKLHAFGLTMGMGVWKILWNMLYSLDSGTYAAYLRHGRICNFDSAEGKIKSRYIYKKGDRKATKDALISNIRTMLDFAKYLNARHEQPDKRLFQFPSFCG